MAETEAWRAANRERQRELYGAPLGELVRRLVRVLGVTQAALAEALGMSPAMLSQLISGRRVKIGDPAVLARFRMLDQRCASGPVAPEEVPGLLVVVRASEPGWSPPTGPSPGPSPVSTPAPSPAPTAVRAAPPTGPDQPVPAVGEREGERSTAAERAAVVGAALRAVAAPARLVAAAAALGPAFPEIAALLRRAAAG